MIRHFLWFLVNFVQLLKLCTITHEKSHVRRYDANGNGYLTLEEARELCFCFAGFLKDLPFRSQSPESEEEVLDEPDFGPEVQAEGSSSDESSDEELEIESIGPNVEFAGDSSSESESEEEDLPGIWFDKNSCNTTFLHN